MTVKYQTAGDARKAVVDHFTDGFFFGMDGYNMEVALTAIGESLWVNGREQGAFFAKRHIENHCEYKNELGIGNFAITRRKENNVLYSAIPLFLAVLWSDGFVVGYTEVVNKKYCKECGHELS